MMCLEGTVFLATFKLACLSLELEHPHNFTVAKIVFTGCPFSLYLLAYCLCALVMSGG